MSQNERFFTGEQAVEWLPELIGKNIAIIGQNNENNIPASAIEDIEFLFYTDTREKAENLIAGLKENSKYRVYKTYKLENMWMITGEAENMPMQFDEFSKWTYEFCMLGFEYDAKLLGWIFPDKIKALKTDKFWAWFEENQDEYHKLNIDNPAHIEMTLSKLKDKIIEVNDKLTFEFSGIMENGKREFILSADGIKDAFQDLLYLFKRSPEFEKWEIIPFKQASEKPVKIKFNNGFVVSKDIIYFLPHETEDGLFIREIQIS